MLCGCDVGLMLFRPKLKSFFFLFLEHNKNKYEKLQLPCAESRSMSHLFFFNITSLLPTTLFVFPTVVLKTGSVEQSESLCQGFRQIGIEHFD